MKFWMKAQKIDQEIRVEYMVNVCDEDILGKELGNTKVYEHFYKGELVDAGKMLSEIQDGTLVNLFGNECVRLAIDAGLVEEANVREIHGIKHAIIMRFE